ncbi:MAG: hypothetical protein QM737_16200 [Ferruginibacter sp.]
MTHAEFIQLTTAKQYETIITKADPIAQRSDGMYNYYLYQLDSFYVEEKYHSRQHSLSGIRSFTNILGLESYLSNINIGSLGVSC